MPEHVSAQAIANKCRAFVREIREGDFSEGSCNLGRLAAQSSESGKYCIDSIFRSFQHVEALLR